MNPLIRKTLPFVDALLLPVTVPSSALLKVIKRIGLDKMVFSRKMFHKLGIMPVLDHFYEPLFSPERITAEVENDRNLPGIDLNVFEQLRILENFNYNHELIQFPLDQANQTEFFYNNSFFIEGDAEYLYNIIRQKKPRKIIEIGSGHSTLMSLNAIGKNKAEDPTYECEIICIEPYANHWLHQLPVTVIRKKVEEVEKSIFQELEENDILFIDSSHMIRPQGDVLYEYFEVLPLIKSGVLVHIHDIFTPRYYPREWMIDMARMWNEQFLLEGFLMFNKEYRIIGALNYLKNNHFEQLSSVSPMLKPTSNPGSFWMVRN